MNIKIIAFFLGLVILFISKSPIYASDFTTDALVTYTVSEDGNTKVNYSIIITNASEESLQKGYDLTLSNITPREIEVREDGKTVTPDLKGTSDETHIVVNFENPVYGIGRKKRIEVSFLTSSIVQKSSDIWEVYIPRLIQADSFSRYSVTLQIPDSFGEEGYIAPPGKMSRDDYGRVYQFQKDEIAESGVQATFGKFQVYSFDLTYHIKNTSWKSKSEEIALPPDTSIQKVYITDIYPKPANVRADEDENWLAQFSLNPFASKDITVKGKAIVFANPRKLLAPKIRSIISNTESKTYWQADDPEIKKLAQELKTPKAIYDFVVSTLTYNYNNAKPETKRLGAVEALKQPDQAICTEFTDLFIALARSAGIPAREIEGFALSDNPKVQPLSLVTDVLHSWPEYWDIEKQVWVPVDPTWGDTTGGQDYFNVFDLKHVAFAIHGKSDTLPYPAGAYRENNEAKKDVYVALAKIENEASGKINVDFNNKTMNPFYKNVWYVTVENTGSTAVYDQNIELFLDGAPKRSETIPILPPFAKNRYIFETPTGILALSQPSQIVVRVGDNTITLPVSKSKTIVTQILFIFSILAALVFLILVSLFRKSIMRFIYSFKIPHQPTILQSKKE